MAKIIQQGAEAIIEKSGNNIIKNRIRKSYRLEKLDKKIRKLRTRAEAKILNKLHKQIPVPKVINSNEKTRQITMEFISGKKLSENLDKLKNKNKIIEQAGKNIAKMHDLGIIHGDLTTSNMILKNKQVYLIDFGLSFHSKRIEDKAVDLHLLRQALEAKHYKFWESLFKSLIKGYNLKDKELILKQLKKVESRGRYKH